MRYLKLILILFILPLEVIFAQNSYNTYQENEEMTELQEESFILDSLNILSEYLENNENEKAFETLNALLKKNPDLELSNLYLIIAENFAEEGNWKKSIDTYKSYLENVLSQPIVPIEEYWNIGWAYYMTGYPEKALEAGLNFARIYPNNPQHNLNLALYYLTLGYVAEATTLYIWAFSITVDSIDLYSLAIDDLQKSKDLFFYAYSKKTLTQQWEDLKALNTIQESP